MKRRLNYYRFYLRIADYSLPALAFAATAYVEKFIEIGSPTAGLGTYSFFSLFLQTSLVWAITSEYYGVSSVQELFRAHGHQGSFCGLHHNVRGHARCPV